MKLYIVTNTQIMYISMCFIQIYYKYKFFGLFFCILCLFPRPQPFVVASRHVQHAPPVRNLTVTNICDKTLFNSPKNTEWRMWKNATGLAKMMMMLCLYIIL